MCEFITKVAKFLSTSKFTSSLITTKISNRDRIGSVKSTFYIKFLVESYLPPTGLAAAITAHFA